MTTAPITQRLADSAERLSRNEFDYSAELAREAAAEIARLQAQVDALAETLRDIGKYTGEGPSTTPWQEIVRDIAQKARDALSSAEPLPHAQQRAKARRILSI